MKDVFQSLLTVFQNKEKADCETDNHHLSLEEVSVFYFYLHVKFQKICIAIKARDCRDWPADITEKIKELLKLLVKKRVLKVTETSDRNIRWCCYSNMIASWKVLNSEIFNSS